MNGAPRFVGGPPAPTSDFDKPFRINAHFFDHPRSDAKFQIFQQIAKEVSVNKIDRWRTISRSFFLSLGGEGPRTDKQSFVCPTNHCPSEIPDRTCGNAALVLLALEINLK